MKMNIYIILFSAIMLLNPHPCNCESISQPIVRDGIADISRLDSSAGRTVELNGKWEFYCGQLLEPRDFKSPSSLRVSYIDVPGNWDSFLFNGKNFGSWGFATYRLKIYTGSDAPLYFKFMPPNSAYRIWANGVYYGECGKVGRSPGEEIPMYKLPVFEFMPVNNLVEIVIQVSNYSIYLGGITLPVIAGQRENVYNEKTRRVAFDIFLFASLLVISVYYSGLYLMRKSDRSYLFFSIFTLLLSIRALVTNEMFLYQLLPHADWQLMSKIDFLTMGIGVSVFIHFIYILYPKVVKRTIRLFFVITSILYIVLIIFSPAEVYSTFLPVYNVITVMASLFVFYVLVRAAVDRQEGARLALFGSVLLFAAVVNDILGVYNIIHTIQLSSFGVLAFILMQSLISSMKFASAYSGIEDLTHNLEIKVDMRTRELEKEKELLLSRNEIIENELVIAKKIQMQIIPEKCPVESMYAFYKPMDMVGGDFYDFLRYRDPAKVGIFVSDVSGHGVPAAFITSMVKTSLLQAGPDRDDPAKLLAVLNELLLNQTGGHFVTAFYGIYDPSARELIYANCGHNPPFVFSSGRVEAISGIKSIPLAMFDNEILESMNKSCANNIVKLEEGDRILFYTDGLTEANSSSDLNEYFEEKLIGELFLKYSDNSPDDFINNIYNEVVKFHGSDSFEDDVCMICMDII